MGYKIIGIIVILFCFFMSLISCTADKYAIQDMNTFHSNFDAEKFPRMHEIAADNLLQNCSVVIEDDQPIIVTSLVDIDEMGKSSTLGRISSEIIAGRLSQQGLKVQEIKMSQSNIFVSEAEGEFILSRNLHQIGEKYDVQGFVVGTYAIGKYHRNDVDVFIALRFVNTEDIIACAYNYAVPGTDPELWW